MSDIFVSYASEDRPRVKPLVDALQHQGWSVWWDRTIRAGKVFDRVIEKALNEARYVIVLWSHDSIDSDWVRSEAHEAKRRGVLVPVLLDEVNIPLAFNTIQAANLVGRATWRTHNSLNWIAPSTTLCLAPRRHTRRHLLSGAFQCPPPL